MVDETDSLKTRLEKDLIIDVGKGNDLVAVTESQATELSNECSRSSSVYSVKDKTASMKSNSSIEKGLNAPLPDDATLPPFKESERHPKQAWWRGRSSDMNVDPKTFSNRKKISITAVIALAASISPISSTIYYPALITVQESLGTTATAINASLSIFTFFTAFFPLMWASFGDIYGRRKIYLLSFSIYVIGSIGCALSVNITMLIIFRAFSAIGSSSVMSLGAGTISDIYYPHERGRAFSWYTCGPLLGPALGFMFFYLLNTTFTRTYTIQYGLSSGFVGICYIPQAVGAMLGGIFGGRYSDNLYRRRVAEAGGESWPEMRLGGVLMWVAVLIQGIAFIAYGWCITKDVHFAWGLVCQFFLGFCLMIPNVAITAYLVDCFRTRGASATACNNFVRYLMAGIGALIASSIESALGDGILYTICGAILILASGLLQVVIVKGKQWGKLRENMS
ncbi:unnamed protein product [Umbelopsis vinacea]